MLALTRVLPLPVASLLRWSSVHTRYLFSNSLAGTIPTQVGDMAALTRLCAQLRACLLCGPRLCPHSKLCLPAPRSHAQAFHCTLMGDWLAR
jgi:hypothetical protein